MKALFCLYSAPLVKAPFANSAPLVNNPCKERELRKCYAWGDGGGEHGRGYSLPLPPGPRVTMEGWPDVRECKSSSAGFI